MSQWLWKSLAFLTILFKTNKGTERFLKSDNYFFISLKLNFSRTNEARKLLIQCQGPFYAINKYFSIKSYFPYDMMFGVLFEWEHITSTMQKSFSFVKFSLWKFHFSKKHKSTYHQMTYVGRPNVCRKPLKLSCFIALDMRDEHTVRSWPWTIFTVGLHLFLYLGQLNVTNASWNKKGVHSAFLQEHATQEM